MSETHTRLRGNTPLPRLGVSIKGWGNPYVWEPSPLDLPQPSLSRIGKGFQWPGKITKLEEYPWAALNEIVV